MPKFPHAVAWLDHHEARVFFFDREESDEKILKPEHARHHLRSKAGGSGGRAPEDHEFFETIIAALSEATGDFLVAGPASAKTELVNHLHRHAAKLVDRLAGVETMAKVSDGELLAFARKYFHAAIWKVAPAAN